MKNTEMMLEDDYNMIDGIRNNRRRQAQAQEAQGSEKHAPVKRKSAEKEPGKRVSVLQRLREKQTEVAARYGKKAPEQSREDVSMERNRK